jgi:DNA/RNA-binding domain of Phe-tRNA-synthetase-like protein
MVEFSVSQDVAAKFAGLNIGVVEGTCARNEISDEAAFLHFKADAEKAARAIEPLPSHPNIIAWRTAFKKFGADPTKTRSSGEAIARRIQKGGGIPRINAIVDIYNCVSALCTLPIGGQDAEKISGSVELRLARGDEKFVPLGSQAPEPVDEGEVIYADSQKVLCSKWNYRDCEDAKISGETERFALFVDGAPGIEREKVRTAAEELSARLSVLVAGCSASARIMP